MKLHVFNPGHDLALAFGGACFTAPHAARQLAADLSFLPALMAEDGDVVLVDDVDNANHQLRHLKGTMPVVHFVTLQDLSSMSTVVNSPFDALCPWGWDVALVHRLTKAVPSLSPLMLTAGQLATIRQMSNRRWAATHLGNSGICCTTVEAAETAMKKMEGRFVLKSPWSSSGRGVRYRADRRWMENVIRQQGGVMVEPLYNKVMDFAMEFRSDGRGRVSYEGLSLFETVSGAYKGNLLASEKEKTSVLKRYVSEEQLCQARKQIIARATCQLAIAYEGPFGIDMMVHEVDGEMLLADCVELNLRCTMGHVALALARRLNPDGLLPHQLMRIEYDGSHYHLRVLNTRDNALNTTQL